MHHLWSHSTALKHVREIFSGLLVVAMLFGDVSLVFAQTFSAPREISYQAKLATSGNVAVPDGTYHVTFRLYTVPTAGAALWTETRTGANRIPVTNGLLSVMLGSVTSLAGVDFNQPLYLGVEIGGMGGAAVWDGEMTPRKSLGTVPSALVADTLDGLDSSAFLRATVTTSYVPEGANLYFTSARATTAVAQLLAGTTTNAIAEGATNWYFTQNRFASSLAGTSTSALAEGTNLYFTNGRVQTYLDGMAKGYFFSTTSADAWKGSTNFFSTTSSDAWLGTKSTSNLTEGTNLYFTSLRATTSFAQLLAATTTSALAEGTNLYYTTLRGAALLAGTTSDALAEGALNKYYTLNRFATDLAGTTTTALAEGTNLYFTNARVSTYLSGMDKGYFFSSTSADAWDTTKSRWGTTSSDAYLATKSTTNLAEGNNLYFTSLRATTSFATLISGTTTNALPEGSTNWYFTQERFASSLAGTTTSALAEGSNLYYTSARATTSFAQLLAGTNTSALAEGSNLYWTTNRFAAALAATDTDALTEGSTNRYFSNALVDTWLGTKSLGVFFSTTSADAWDTTKSRWGTTSADYWITTKSLTAASSTLLGDANTFAGTNQFARLTATNATATNATSTNLFTQNINISGTAGYQMNGLTLATASTTHNNFYFASAVENTGATGGLSYNIAMGPQAMQYATSGQYNFAAGQNAMRGSVFNANTGSGNAAIGYDALLSNTTGTYNNALGYFALRSNTIGVNNNALGYYALYDNTTGSSNNAFGFQPLANNSSGYSNNAFGWQAMNQNQTGSRNNALGEIAMYMNNSGSYNNAFGYAALQNNTSASALNAIGWKALNLTTGASSTAVGSWAGQTNTSGNNNLYLGDEADALAGTYSNSAAIGSHAKVGASNSIVLGGTGAWAANVAIGTSTPWAKLSIQNTYGSQTALFDVATSTNASGSATTSIFTVLPNGKVGVGTSSPNARLGVSLSVSGGTNYAIQALVSGNSGTNYGAHFSAGGDSGVYYGAKGEVVFADHTAPDAYGLYGAVTKGTGPGVISNAYGLYSSIVRIGGTVTNGYGLYLDNVNATNAYGLYQSSATNTNYFAGSVGIGTTSPFAKLSVAGDIYATGTVTGTTGAFTGLSSTYSTTTNATTTSFFASSLTATNGRLTALTSCDTIDTDSSGNLICGTDSGAGGSSEVNWAFFNNSGVRLGTTTNQVLIGGAATTSLAALEVQGNQYVSGNLGIGTTSPYAKLSVAGNGLFDGAVTASSFNATSSTGYQLNGVTIAMGSTTKNNYFFGAAAINSSVTSGFMNNIAIGLASLQYATSGGDNIAIGLNAMRGINAGNGNTGSDNTALGSGALVNNTSGSYNNAFGRSSLAANSAGSSNNALGHWALQANTTGSNNNALGLLALGSNTLGENNNAFGQYALRSNVTGSSLNSIGWNSLFNTTGASSTALGSWAGQTNTTGNNNLYLGDEADALAGTYSNSAAIGSHAKVGASNSIVLGGTGAWAANVGIGTTSPFAHLSVAGDIFATGTITSTGASFTNATTTNATSTNLFASAFSALSASFTNLFFGNATGTNATTTSFSTQNLSVTGVGTSTFANGIQLSGGCFRDAAGTCVGGGKESTYVVAAANSTNKAYADYVTDFSSDEVEINQAITAAYANGRGGKVYLLEGDYVMSTGASNKIVMASSTALIGSGPSTILHVASSTNANMYVIYGPPNANNITIRDLQIDGNSSNQSSNFQSGIVFNNVSTSTVANVIANNHRNIGMELYGSNITVTGSTANSNFYYGIYMNGATNSVVAGNTANSNVTGIRLNGASGNSVVGNIANDSNYGIHLSGSSHKNTVTGNIANNPGAWGIRIEGASHDNSISSNIVEGLVAFHVSSDSSRNSLVGNTYTGTITDTSATTRYTQSSRLTLDTLSYGTVAYSPLSIYASSSAALASTTQMGTGKIMSLNNSLGEMFTVANNGNVGVGTTSPYAKLSVAGAIHTATPGTNNVSVGYANTDSGSDSVLVGFNNLVQANGVVIFGSNNSAGFNTGSMAIGLSNNSTSGGVSIGRSNTTGIGSAYAIGEANTASAAGSFAIGANINNSIANSLQIGPSDSAKISILSNGNVGIGTTTPWAKLSIQNTYGSQTTLFDVATTTSSAYATTSIFKIDASGAVTIASPSINENTPSNIFSVNGGVNSNTYGRAISLTGGDGSGFGGAVSLSGGYGTTLGSSVGGAVTIRGGKGNSQGGQVNLLAGDGRSAGGWINLFAGSATSSAGDGGGISLLSGNAILGDGGAINLTAGTALNNFGGNGGNITLTPGSGTTTVGSILLAPTFGNVGIGTTTPYAKLSVVGEIVGAFFTGTTTATSTFGGNLAITGTGTTTSNGGFNITNGCFAIAGVCVGGSSASSTLYIDNNTFSGTNQFAQLTFTNATGTNATTTSLYTQNINLAASSAGYQMNGVTIAAGSTTKNNYYFAGATTSALNLGTYNYAIGQYAMANATSVSFTNNIALGYSALMGSTTAQNTGDYNVAIGPSTLRSNTSGQNNTALGNSALEFNTTGSANFAVGQAALRMNTSGYSNNALGYLSMVENTTGAYNNAFGEESLRNNTTGNSNSALGYLALVNNTTGSYNIAVGEKALLSNDSGGSSVGLGWQALLNTYGASSTALGTWAGQTNTTGNNNLYLGDEADALAGTYSNSAAIGSHAKVGASNSIVLGGTGAWAVNVGIGMTNPTATLDVVGTGGIRYNRNGSGATVLLSDYVGSSPMISMTGSDASVPTYLNSNGALNIYTGGLDPSTATLGMTVTGGNVGIGTTSPYAKLSVAGEIVGAFFTGTTTATSTFGGNLAILGTGTTTSNGGFNITNGCFAIAGVCVGGSSASSTLYIDNGTWTGLNQFAKLTWTNATGTSATTTNLFTQNINISGDAGYQMNGLTLATASTTKNNFYYAGATTTGTNLGTNNIAMGLSAMQYATSGAYNIAMGVSALRGVSGNANTGSDNIAIGKNALLSNRSGYSNVAIGTDALTSNTTGFYNNAFGQNALTGNTSGLFNNAFGAGALFDNQTGSDNSAFGDAALNQSTGSKNSAFGSSALYNNFAGNYNTAVGMNALYSNVNSSGHAAIGYEALRNTSGASSTAVGSAAGKTNTTGNNNLYLGDEADALAGTYSNSAAIGSHAKVGSSNSIVLGGTGAWAANVGIGTSTPWAKLSIQNTYGSQTALFDVASSTNASGSATTSLFRILANGTLAMGSTTNASIFINGGGTTTDALNAQNNIAIGNQAFSYYASGALRNIAFGPQALYGSSSAPMTGDDNFAVGGWALYKNTTGYNNVAIGNSALYSNTTGGDNNALGYLALWSNTSGINNNALGYLSLGANTTGSDNNAFGANALDANISGFGNNALGNAALGSNTSGIENNALGTTVLLSNTTGSYNNAMGKDAMRLNGTGSYNNALGYNALFANSSGHNNNALGAYTLDANTTGAYNNAFGVDSLGANTTGASSTAIGANSGRSNTTGSLNVYLGLNAGYREEVNGTQTGPVTTNNLTNSIAIGANAQVGASNSLVLGGRGAYSVNTVLGTTTPWAKLSIMNTAGDQTALFDVASSTNANGSATTSLFRIAANGNVGIGTTSPSAKLAINGTITPTGAELITNGTFTGSAAGWTLGDCATYGSNQVTVLNTACSDKSISTTFTSVAGQTYIMTFDVVGNNDQVYIYFSNNPNEYGPFATGTHTVALTTNFTGTETIIFESWNYTINGGWTIDNVSIKESPNFTPALVVKGYDGSTWLSLGDTTNNLAMGKEALQANTSGTSNTAIGDSALSSNTTGSYSTALGYLALSSNTTEGNTAVGAYALNENDAGWANTAVGINALSSNVSGAFNTANGHGALSHNKTGYGNAAFGAYALAEATGGDNVAVGVNTLRYNVTGTGNVAVGSSAMGNGTSGSYNSAIGLSALNGSMSGSYNVAHGYQAASYNVSATNTTAIGSYAGFGNWDTYSNQGGVYLGYSAGYSASTGSDYNTMVGYQSGYGVTTGARNVLMGYNAGYSGTNLTTGSDNIIIGNNIGATSTGMTRGLNIGNLIFGTGLDGTGTTLSSGNIGIGTTTPSAKLSVVGEVLASFFTATTTATSTFAGPIAIGSSTQSSAAKLTIDGTMSMNGVSTAIAGIHEIYTFNPTAGGTQVGDRLVIQNMPTSATNTAIGQIVRVVDNSGISNLVRGMDVTAAGGNNTWGVNTGIRTTGHTFGIQALTTGLAGGSSTPAAIYGESSGTTLGEILRLYTNTMTTATSVAQFYQEGSAFSGTGLLMNFGAGTGSFTGNFADFQLNGNSRFKVTAGGTTTIGQLSQTAVQAGLQVVNGGICVDNDGACVASTSGRVSAVSYTTGSTDLAENYFSSTTLTAGNIVMTDGGAQITLATNTKKVLGVVSTEPGVILGLGNDGPLPGQYPVALSGRVPVHVNLENGPIRAGDRITLSRTMPGVGARAIATSSLSVGIALEDWSGNTDVMDTMATGTVLAFVSLSSRDLSDHVVGSQFALTASSTGEVVSLFALSDDESEVRYLADRPFSLSGAELTHARAIFSENGNWSLDEEGILTVEEVHTKKVKASEEICIQDVCVNRDQLNALLINAGLNNAPAVTEPISSGVPPIGSDEPLPPSDTPDPVPADTPAPVVIPEPTPDSTVTDPVVLLPADPTPPSGDTPSEG